MGFASRTNTNDLADFVCRSAAWDCTSPEVTPCDERWRIALDRTYRERASARCRTVSLHFFACLVRSIAHGRNDEGGTCAVLSAGISFQRRFGPDVEPSKYTKCDDLQFPPRRRPVLGSGNGGDPQGVAKWRICCPDCSLLRAYPASFTQSARVRHR